MARLQGIGRGGMAVTREGSGMLGRDQVKEGMPC